MKNYVLERIERNESEELIDFLNRCFGTDFKREVPKIYMHDTTDNHYVIRDEKRIIGAICIEFKDLHIRGNVLKAALIGSVCTDAEYRNMGIMTYMMNESNKIIKDRADISFLCGNYERYHRFGYERVNADLYHIDKINDDYVFYDISLLNDDEIGKIYCMSREYPHIDMNMDDFKASLKQWKGNAYAIYDKDLNLIGYMTDNGREVCEIRARASFEKILESYKKRTGIEYVILPGYEKADLAKVDYLSDEMYKIIEYDRVKTACISYFKSFDMAVSESFTDKNDYGMALYDGVYLCPKDLI